MFYNLHTINCSCSLTKCCGTCTWHIIYGIASYHMLESGLTEHNLYACYTIGGRDYDACNVQALLLEREREVFYNHEFLHGAAKDRFGFGACYGTTVAHE